MYLNLILVREWDCGGRLLTCYWNFCIYMCRFLIVWKLRSGCLIWRIVFTKYTGSSITKPIILLIFRSTFSVIRRLYYNRCWRLPQPPVHLLAVCVDGDNLQKILSKETTWAELFLRFQQWDVWDSVAISKPKYAEAKDGLGFISWEEVWVCRRKRKLEWFKDESLGLNREWWPPGAVTAYTFV